MEVYLKNKNKIKKIMNNSKILGGSDRKQRRGSSRTKVKISNEYWVQGPCEHVCACTHGGPRKNSSRCIPDPGTRSSYLMS